MSDTTDEFLCALTRATLTQMEAAWPTLTNIQKGVANLDCRLYVEQAAQWPLDGVDWNTIRFVSGVVRLVRDRGRVISVERAVAVSRNARGA